MKTLLLISLLFLSCHTYAQYVSGNVKARETNEPVSSVLIYNKHSFSGVYTDSSGYFNIKADPGDSIAVISFNHKPRTIIAQPANGKVNILLERNTHELKEVQIVTELEKYQRDHVEMLQTYNKQLTDADRKVEVGFSNGPTVTGIFSELASRISGYKKKVKRFKKDFERTEKQKLISIRYNPQMVVAITNTTIDSAVLFIKDNPIDFEFARAATGLEFMMWIRYNYRKWAGEESTEEPQK